MTTLNDLERELVAAAKRKPQPEQDLHRDLESIGKGKPRPEWPALRARLAYHKLLRVETCYKQANLLKPGDVIVDYWPGYREYEVSRTAIRHDRGTMDVYVRPPKWELDYLRGKDRLKMGMPTYAPILIRTGPDLNQTRVG